MEEISTYLSSCQLPTRFSRYFFLRCGRFLHRYGFNLLIPFLTLALATNTFSFKNKLYKTLFGIGVIIAWNSFLVFIWYFLVERVKHSDTISIQQRFEFTAIALTFLNGIFPFLLWIILFRENIKKLYYNKKCARTTP